MNKKTIRLISLILLITVIFKMLFPSFIFAADSSLDPSNETIFEGTNKNPTFNSSRDPRDPDVQLEPRTDDEGNPLTDGERQNEDIDYSREDVTNDLLSGSAPKRETDEGSGILSAGTNILTFILSIFATTFAKIPAAIYILLNFMYHEEPPKDIDSEQYKGIKTHLFTLENLFFNRVRILDANIFKKSDKPNGTNQSIKDNVATWTATIREIALVIILFIMVYLAIRLIVATIQQKPAARANYKSFLIDIFISVFLAFLAPFFVAIVMYASEILTDIIREIAKTLISQDNLNFEKVIIYSFMDVFGFITNPTTKLINTISFILLVTMHVKFLWMFTRRFLSIAFLTMISPLISITYAIDKFKDGETQVFKSWAQEVSRLAFLMPLYAGMYTVFAIAMSPLAEKAPILGLVFLLFFGQIEKVIKETFDMKSLVGVKSAGDYTFNAGALKSKQDEEKKKKQKDYYDE